MAGGPPFTLTVFGTNFSPGNSDVLLWNGVQQIAPFVAVNSGGTPTQLTYVIDAGLIANPGPISIVLIVPTAPPDERPSNTVTLTIVPRGATACDLFGLYDFLFTGFETNSKGFGRDTGGVTFTGAFGVDASGNLSGEVDFTNYPFFLPTNLMIGGTCTNSVTPNQGTLTYHFVNGIISPTDTFTYTFVLQQGGNGPPRGRLVEPGDMTGFFGAISGSGVFAGTAPNGVLNGDFAFGLVGTDPEAGGLFGGQVSVVGRFTYANGSLSAGVGDINDGGSVTANAPLSAAGNTPPPDLYSRTSLQLTIGGQQAVLVIYVNSSGGGFAIGVIPPNTSVKGLAGFVSPQAHAGAYNNGSLNAPLVFSAWGVPAPLYTGSSFTAPSATTLGLASGFNGGAGTFNLLFDKVAGGVSSLNQAVTGATYSVAGNGRAAISYTSGGNTVDYVFYLQDFNDGFILGTSGNAAEFGFFQPQAPGPFSAATINGTFAGATFLPMTPGSPNLASEIMVSNGNISANTPAGALTGTCTIAASGRGTATVNLPVFGTRNLVLYVISPSSVELMGSDNTMANAITFMHF